MFGCEVSSWASVEGSQPKKIYSRTVVKSRKYSIWVDRLMQSYENINTTYATRGLTNTARQENVISIRQGINVDRNTGEKCLYGSEMCYWQLWNYSINYRQVIFSEGVRTRFVRTYIDCVNSSTLPSSNTLLHPTEMHSTNANHKRRSASAPGELMHFRYRTSAAVLAAPCIYLKFW